MRRNEENPWTRLYCVITIKESATRVASREKNISEFNISMEKENGREKEPGNGANTIVFTVLGENVAQ